MEDYRGSSPVASREGVSSTGHPRDERERDRAPRPRRIIYIARLPDDVTDAEIEQEFRRKGRIRNMTVSRDEHNMCLGHAFIEYADARDADDAIYAYHNRRVFGRTLTVEYAKKPPRMSSSSSSRPSSRDAPYERRRSGPRPMTDADDMYVFSFFPLL